MIDRGDCIDLIGIEKTTTIGVKDVRAWIKAGEVFGAGDGGPTTLIKIDDFGAYLVERMRKGTGRLEPKADTLREDIESFLKRNNYDPEGGPWFMSTAQIRFIARLTTWEDAKIPMNKITSMVAALRLPELKRHTWNSVRGWIWTGKSPTNSKVLPCTFEDTGPPAPSYATEEIKKAGPYKPDPIPSRASRDAEIAEKQAEASKRFSEQARKTRERLGGKPPPQLPGVDEKNIDRSPRPAPPAGPILPRTRKKKH